MESNYMKIDGIEDAKVFVLNYFTDYSFGGNSSADGFAEWIAANCKQIDLNDYEDELALYLISAEEPLNEYGVRLTTTASIRYEEMWLKSLPAVNLDAADIANMIIDDVVDNEPYGDASDYTFESVVRMVNSRFGYTVEDDRRYSVAVTPRTFWEDVQTRVSAELHRSGSEYRHKIAERLNIMPKQRNFFVRTRGKLGCVAAETLAEAIKHLDDYDDADIDNKITPDGLGYITDASGREITANEIALERERIAALYP